MCRFHHEDWTMQWIRQQYRPDHKQIVMPFSPIFDDAVLPQAFVSGLGRSCQARCYPRSPPKNLRPRAAAPQTLNRSIRHTMLRAAGVWAVAVGACLVWALSQTHIRSCTPHCKSTTLLLLTQLTYSFVSNVPLSYHWLLFLSVARWPIFLPLVPPAQAATDLHCENTHNAYLPICSVADFDFAPPASHLSRVYPNMKINSQLNAAICSPKGSGEKKSNTSLHWWTAQAWGKESLKAGIGGSVH